MERFLYSSILAYEARKVVVAEFGEVVFVRDEREGLQSGGLFDCAP